MTAPSIETVTSRPGLSSALRDQILAVDAAAERVDGVAPLDDQVRIDLAGGGGPELVRHLVARWAARDEIVGYAHGDLRAADDVSGHLVVAPTQRRRGVGTSLLDKLAAAAGQVPLRVWAHGNTVAAQAFAKARDLEPVRELRKMRRPLDAEIPSASYPPDVSVRTFVPGRDDEAWVQINAAAFSHHPEQGRLSADDLHQRIEQPWFDPLGFFLAERDGELVGYHWTKVHSVGGEGVGPVGEVYVLGVDPGVQGLGLGKALTLTGLHHLQDEGMKEVILYVDGDNLPAVAVYERLGFTTASVDVMYARA